MRAADDAGLPAGVEDRPTAPRRSVSGRASSARRSSVAPHSLTWVDRATGETMQLELNCDEAFARGLASTGFERVARIRTESANEEHETMTIQHDDESAESQYAEAHALHYEGCDHVGALQAYERILVEHPGADEADSSRSQIDQIVNQVVPAAKLLAAKLALARNSLAHRPTAPAQSGA